MNSTKDMKMKIRKHQWSERHLESRALSSAARTMVCAPLLYATAAASLPPSSPRLSPCPFLATCSLPSTLLSSSTCGIRPKSQSFRNSLSVPNNIQELETASIRQHCVKSQESKLSSGKSQAGKPETALHVRCVIHEQRARNGQPTSALCAAKSFAKLASRGEWDA